MLSRSAVSPLRISFALCSFNFFRFGLIEGVFADREIFVGDAVGLKENSLRSRHAFGDDLFQRQDIFPTGDASLTGFDQIAAVGFWRSRLIGGGHIFISL